MGLETETVTVRRMRPRKTSGNDIATNAPQTTDDASLPRDATFLPTVTFLRLTWTGLIILFVINHQAVQQYIDQLWAYLLTTWVFNSVYFETWWATFCYVPILAVPFTMDKIPAFNRYKIEPCVMWQSAGLKKILLEAIVYCTPLMTLDTFMVKKYTGVDPQEWEILKQTVVQRTRALPAEPPTVFQVAWQLAATFILYDLMFYLVHMTVHKNMWLYTNVHASHHNHDVVFSRVTNQLTVVERIVLVLAANQALKMVHSHPLTRAIFVPLFIAMLVENHCGYDLPFTFDKVVPLGLYGGAAHHYEHHACGSRNYEPFFTYFDKVVNALSKRRGTRRNPIYQLLQSLKNGDS